MLALLSTSRPSFSREPQGGDPIPGRRVGDKKSPSFDFSPEMICRGTKFWLAPATGSVLQLMLRGIYRGTVAFFRRDTPRTSVPAKQTMMYRGTAFTR